MFLPELNRCHLDLSELNRLIKSLQTLEVGQAFTNGDLKRIISIQVHSRNQFPPIHTSIIAAYARVFVWFLTFFPQNLSLEKPKKSKSGKIWGHSRTLSRVEALGMVRTFKPHCHHCFNSCIFPFVKYRAVTFWGLSLIRSPFERFQNR